MLRGSGYTPLASPMALLAAPKQRIELAGIKQWWGSEISEIAVDASWQQAYSFVGSRFQGRFFSSRLEHPDPQ